MFNIADASIVTGLVILGWIFFWASPQGEPDSGAAPANDWVFGPIWCPICDGDMVVVAIGWRCAYCGVRERIELPQRSNPTITPAHPPAPTVANEGPAMKPNPASAPATKPDLSDARATAGEALLPSEKDLDPPARIYQNPGTGSTPPELSRPEV